MKVKQLINANGNANANQFVISDEHKMIFQSYNSTVCVYDWAEKKVTLGRDWDYSRTTMKHLNTFLRDYTFSTLVGADSIRKAITKGYCNAKFGRLAVEYDENLQ